jgi:hypothetical protein
MSQQTLEFKRNGLKRSLSSEEKDGEKNTRKRVYGQKIKIILQDFSNI